VTKTRTTHTMGSFQRNVAIVPASLRHPKAERGFFRTPLGPTWLLSLSALLCHPSQKATSARTRKVRLLQLRLCRNRRAGLHLLSRDRCLAVRYSPYRSFRRKWEAD
jgi:hypothetical protein